MIDIIKEKLKSYGATNTIELENATKEIMQDIALYGLWRADFFDVALFQGDTSLRILHGLPRFSEDLDFMLRAPDHTFDWLPYLKTLEEVYALFGLRLEARAKANMDTQIRQAVLKDTSIAQQLDLSLAPKGRAKTLKIKLEIDIHPPAFSDEATTYLDFPADFEVRHQDLSSNFALKLHALLCRGYVKGRDWFDFSWYVAKGIKPNLRHLEAALRQNGPWSGQDGLLINKTWLQQQLHQTIARINWQDAALDVRRFLRPDDIKSLELWSERFFATKLEKLIGYITETRI